MSNDERWWGVGAWMHPPLELLAPVRACFQRNGAETRRRSEDEDLLANGWAYRVWKSQINRETCETCEWNCHNRTRRSQKEHLLTTDFTDGTRRFGERIPNFKPRNKRNTRKGGI
jgi:hypothetical protein